MALAEDAATILDEFVQDASNLPAEIAHLLEEIQAKDQAIAECRMFINAKDSALQKHVKQFGGHVKHAKEDAWLKAVALQYDKAQALQEDKVAISEKTSLLLDRQVRRLDIKIRNLQNEGSMLEDQQLPSLLHSSPANLVEPVSANRSGVSTPLNHLQNAAGNARLVVGGSNEIVSARAVTTAASQIVRSAPQAPMVGATPSLAAPVPAVLQRQRESSQGASEAKRRRFNGNLGTLPVPSSNLARQSSAGPGTPKAGTPGSRAGSLGPRPKKVLKRPGDHPLRKKMHRPGMPKKGRRPHSDAHGSPSTTGDDNSDASGSEDDAASQAQGNEADDDVGDAAYEEDGDDNELYCICRNPSHGAMVACDNSRCQYEWFHYECVGLKEEPKGKWLCPECRKLPPKEIKMSK